ncbi:MAG: TIGR00645 family protein [Bacteroidota bacterium]|nr:TIGR00645 family protein [Bacteroidota bacterium]
MAEKSSFTKGIENGIESFIFASRWLQAPIYIGLIIASGIYVFKFFQELVHLSETVLEMNEVQVMLAILGLIDISMVMNLLMIVIIGGYTIFTSRIDFGEQEDKPQWLDNMDSGILKIKLASSLATISGVHLLKTFIDIHEEIGDGGSKQGLEAVYVEIVIHIIFIISALLLAYVERILHDSHKAAHDPHLPKEIRH